ncbi:cbb3-type cytochrome c oxidase subunit I [Phaeovulum sp.]|uniref:cbb3-type cytochrome c oxidase subunit I n=1 Tax=Phaeovulum sp. TaxID=2934796 RepID=UPI002730DCE4|nr:cbb3-type cytochrome c oxidase subunit I [Phaeovulum sp.]MDP1668106.1 cbb3-type cytochrome c oxidase subunit I [Phaeovulum sp.]MDZ4119011.1 cbb3-type cytochrome c oxidase subunit I [Phaeovulum sp.]
MTDIVKRRFAALPGPDQYLLRSISAIALLALAIGVAGGVLTALARAGFLDLLPETAYRMLTLHGVNVFFFWLYMAQAALLLGFAAIEDGRGLALRGVAVVGFAAMLGGFLVSLYAASSGTPLLYDGTPALAAEEPATLLAFNGGYVLLGLGLMVLPVAPIATLLRKRPDAPREPMSATGFALFVWAGFLIVSGFAAIHAFLPGMLWALGLGAFPASQGTNWHILFHNLHYLPLMATVLIWYVLVQALTGVKSVFGARFSKIVFSAYLVFVPPTSLYHMFLEPDLPATVRVVGSLLSLFVSVPTLTAFLIIIASLEVHARANGARGLFGWLGHLPWRNPAMAAMGAAVLNMGLGLALAFVLIQAELAPLLSDTFFVPGYFHFFTVGTVSFTLLAAFSVMLPGLGGRNIAWPGVMRWMPWLATFGLLLFGGAGVAAGYLGVPRRVMDISYGGEAPAYWQALMATVGAGGSVMALALTVFAAGVAMALMPRRIGATVGLPDTGLGWGAAAIPAGTKAWVGPLAILVIVLAMYGFTTIGFELMQSLPLTASGGAGH